VRRQIAARILANYSRLKALSASAPSSRVLKASGGWYAVVQVPTLRSEEELVLDLLVRDGVLAHPGYFFDFPRESYLIVSLLTPEASFASGVGRILERVAVRGWQIDRE
jgi:alanine-synthesizing transaminase